MKMNNQFFDNWKNAMNPEGFANMMKNAPTLEHLGHAKHIALENMGHVANKFIETMQHNTNEFVNFFKESMNAQSAEEVGAKWQHAAKNSMQKSMENGKEVLDLATKSSMELFNKCSAGCSADMNPNMNMHKPKK
jgi:phasin family protein